MKGNYFVGITVLAGLALLGNGQFTAQAGCGACGTHHNEPKIKAACCPKGTPVEKQCAKCQPKAKAKGCKACASGTACKTGACVAGKQAAATPEVGGHNISTETLQVLLNSGVKVTILDARGGKYDDGRRIPGAKGLPANADEKSILSTAGSKDGLIVTYCANPKCPASAALAKRLATLGYTNVLEYPFGIDGWAAAGLDMEHAK